MGRKRRYADIHDASSWVFNRMAEVYGARPGYPVALVDDLVRLATSVGPRVLDLGAGIGHLALPLVERGLEVVAIEPAKAMLEHVERSAAERGLRIRALHAKAEALPFDGPAFDLALLADVLHFVDTELAATELRRVLVPRGVLAIVTCDFAATPFMSRVRELVDEQADRRPRDVEQAIRQLASLARVDLTLEQHYEQATPVDPATLERILRSVSFIGPALNSARFAALRQGLRAVEDRPVWARTFTLRAGRRRRTRSKTACRHV